MRKFISLMLPMTVALGACGDDGKSPNIPDPPSPPEGVVVETCDNGLDDDGDGLTDCAQRTCQMQAACMTIPGDPVAPSIADTGIPDFFESVRFLWEGDNPVVLGLDPTALDSRRIAIIRGRVLDRDGNPVSGLHASIVGQADLGYTYSRANGEIDLVANGGGDVTVRWEGLGFPAVDRVVDAPRRDYAHAEDIVVTPYDTAATAVDLSQGGTHVATASSDTDGQRSMRLYFEPSTTATLVAENGDTTDVQDITVRATEYTVGATGLDAMPAGLPQESAYTYAAELTVDEARATGAVTVQFDKDVTLFLDNFLDLPVGTIVPNGLYNRQTGVWEGAENGVVAKIVSGGLDLTGDDTADEVTVEGYPAGIVAAAQEFFSLDTTFWLARVPHFTPCDLNFPYEWPEGAVDPSEIPEFPSSRFEKPCKKSGSIIECQNQVLAKSLDIPGSDLRLNYRSDRTVGRGRAFDLALTGETVSPDIQYITVEVEIAGKRHRVEYAPVPNITYHFEWDGLDAYGREVMGKRFTRVTVSYWYDVNYYVPQDTNTNAWGQPGSDFALDEGRVILPRRSRYWGYMGGANAQTVFGLGGWQLSAQHAWDGNSRTFYAGSNGERSSAGVGLQVKNHDTLLGLESTFGWNVSDYAGGGGPKVELQADGSMYVLFNVPNTPSAKTLWHRGAGGTWTRIAGNTLPGDTTAADCRNVQTGDGCYTSDAVNAPLFGNDFVVANDGTIYLHATDCIFRLVDNAYGPFAGDCLPAEERPDDFPWVRDMSVAPNGRIFASDFHEIWEFMPTTKNLVPIAGAPDFPAAPPATLGESALGRDINGANLIAATNDGIYFTHRDDEGIRFVDYSSRYDVRYFGGDNAAIRQLTADPDGNIYFNELEGLGGGFIKRLTGEGNAETVVGGSAADILATGNLSEALAADGVPANAVLLGNVDDLEINGDDQIFYTTTGSIDGSVSPLIKVASSLFGESISPDSIIVPSYRATQMHTFDLRGRIQHTDHALTGGRLLTFEYNDDNLLVRVIEPDRGTLTIERDSGGLPTALVAPGGVTTTLDTNGSGNLDQINYPDGRTITLQSGNGLITSFTNGGITTTYTYDPMGRLTRVDDADGGWQTLTRVSGGVIYETSSGTSTEWSGLFGPTPLWDLGGTIEVTDRHGLGWLHETTGFGLAKATQRPDGTITRTELGADSRFGAQAYFLKGQSTETPSGLVQEMTSRREYTYPTSEDRSVVGTRTDTTTVNGATTTTVWDTEAKTLTTNSPEGRTLVRTVDDQGRLVSLKVGSFDPVTWQYTDGYVTRTQQGARYVDWVRDDSGFASSMTSNTGETTTFGRDDAGKTTSTTTGGATWTKTYGSRGYLASASGPSSSPEVLLTYDGKGKLATTEIPGAGDRAYVWNADRSLASITAPDAGVAAITYDLMGRPETETSVARTLTRSYDATTGQVVSVNTADTTTAITYDGFAITSTRHTVGPADVTLNRTLNDNFRTTTLGVGNVDVDYAYDADGFTTAAGGMSITRGTAAEVTNTAIGKVTHERDFDTSGLPTAERYYVDAALVYGWAAIYDADGRISKITEDENATAVVYDYTYDTLGRLSSVDYDTVATETYAWAGARRRTAANGNAATFDVDDRMNTQGSWTLTYDANGNIDSLDDTVNVTTFAYDVYGLATGSTGPAGAVTFTYDGLGNRVGLTRNASFERGWLYDGSRQPVAQLDAAGNVDMVFVYATKDNAPDLVLKSGVAHRLVTDWRGSVRMVINTISGAVEQTRKYDAFGVETSSTNPSFQPFAYAGGLDVGIDGVWAFASRMYAPALGRFLQPDPTGLGGGFVDLWSYTGGDPINYIDQNGETAVHVAIGVMGGLVVLAVPAVYAHHVATTSANGALYDFSADVGNLSGEAECGIALGAYNGPGDAVKHCTLSCTLERRFGTTIAQAIVDANEAKYGDDNPADEEGMDDHNNSCGLRMSEQYPDEPCFDLCRGAFFAGDLEVLNEARWGGKAGPSCFQ